MTEAMAFGLGAGACFYFVPMDGQSPSRFTNGRTSRLEEQFVDLTGAPLELKTFDDPDASWQAARGSVDAGKPAILLSDLYYLDHYGNSAHFPGHAVVLAGYDGEVAYLSDTGFEELQTTRLENLAKARHAQHPVFPLAGHMFVAADGLGAFDPASAIPRAVARCAERMLDPPLGEYEGLPGMRRFAAEVGKWPHIVEDWQWCVQLPGDRTARHGRWELPQDVCRVPRRGWIRRGGPCRGGSQRLDAPCPGPAGGERVRRAGARALVADRRRGDRGARRRGAALAGSPHAGMSRAK